MNRRIWSTTFTLLLTTTLAFTARGKGGVWTDADADDLLASYHVQGEYVGEDGDGNKVGVQVIALGDDYFHAVVYPGGLPGAGWGGEHKSLMDGETAEGKTAFKPADGKRRYLAGDPHQFSATKKFPPDGHKPYTATVADGKMTLVDAGGNRITLQRTVRKSETLGAAPPDGAIVLFDGSDKDAWNGGRLDEGTKLLNTDGKNIRSKKAFDNYRLHLEFMLPYKPKARGQGRGNSGLYHVDGYETQILDSFGLEGLNNECGGIYKKANSKVNMCLPPLQWQTYDVEFYNAEKGEDGKKTSNARITLKLNGVVIHDDFEINGKTGGASRNPEGTPGPIKLQGHGNPLQFRNIWIVPLPDKE